MSAHDSAPLPDPGSGRHDNPHESGTQRFLKAVGTGLGCLFLLVGGAVLVIVALAYFFEEPAIAIAAIALVVAMAAYKSRRGTP